MEKRLLFGALVCLTLGSVSCQRVRFPGSRDVAETVDPSGVLVIADRNSISETKGGLPPPKRPLTGRPLPESELRQIITEVNKNVTELVGRIGKRPLRGSATVPFGPHLRTSERAREIGSIGRTFVETARRVRDRQPLSGGRNGGNSPSETDTRQLIPCPFDPNVKCDARSPYRTITGVCNNLANPLWGSVNTPFERSAPSAYDDGFDSPRSRSILNRPLPLPRVVSTTIHTASVRRNLDNRFTQITMEFGQFVSHDIERFAAITEPSGEELVCCEGQTPDTTRFGCFPIDIPANDPFFGQFNRRCMEMVRALATPNLRCKVGVREQLNQESAYLDGSAVYGSTEDLANELRLFIGGLLKTTDSPDGELLLQDPTLQNPQCRSQSRQLCFRAGDERVNQQPALMSMHTLWLREHNRVARALQKINRYWNDEKLYQEARRIVSAEFQHVVYNEFLPVLLGKEVARAFDFPAKRSGYNSDYDASINPQIRSAFSSAAYRVGHTLVQRLFSESQNFKFRDHFLRPDVLYQARQGPSSVIKSLFMDRQQKCDRLISPQLTNTLFEQNPGTGIDLAATNIQRGRDFGTPSYNVFRVLCGLPPARNFRARRGGLVDHTREAARLLEQTYDHVDDIDLWTGGISEKILKGAVIGPTLACVIGRQFFLLKKGDRFFYENDDRFAKFSLDQLDEIRRTSLSRIICDNTNAQSVQRLAFRYPDPFRNPTTSCRRIPKVDLSQWGSRPSCVNGGWSAWTKETICLSGFKFQFRFCDNPTPTRCGKNCEGFSFRWKRCGRTRSKSSDAAEVARKYAPEGVVI